MGNPGGRGRTLPILRTYKAAKVEQAKRLWNAREGSGAVSRARMTVKSVADVSEPWVLRLAKGGLRRIAIAIRKRPWCHLGGSDVCGCNIPVVCNR